MKRKTAVLLTSIICGLPGTFIFLSGVVINLMGILSNEHQLKLDTNLDRTSVIFTGVGGIVIGLILIAIPFSIWLTRSKHK